MKRTVLRDAAGAALALTLLVACGGDDGGDDAGGDGGGTEVASDVAAEGDGGSAGGGSARVDDVDPADVVAEQTVPVSGSADDEVTVGVHSLVVRDDVMVLRLVMTPEFASERADADINVYTMVGERNFSPKLIDTANLKEYSVIGEGAWRWSSDTVGTKAANGEPVLAWAYFAAPEDDIDTIEVRVADEWPSFLDVPITR